MSLPPRLAFGAQSHQAGRGKEAKEAREEAGTGYSGDRVSAGYRVWGAKSPGRARKGSERSERGGGGHRVQRGYSGVPRLGRKVTRQGEERKRKKRERRRGQGTAGYSAGTAFGAQSHQGEERRGRKRKGGGGGRRRSARGQGTGEPSSAFGAQMLV